MKFTRVLKEVMWCLLSEGKISYRRIKQDFGLDDEGLDELRSVLIDVKGWARDLDGRYLVWVHEAPLPHDAAPTRSGRGRLGPGGIVADGWPAEGLEAPAPSQA